MDTYSFKWRRVGEFKASLGLWSVEKPLIGHRFDKDQDKMVVYYRNGSVKEIAKWSQCEVFLDTDWVIFTKTQMEKEANTSVKLSVDAK
jgi:hypothetical protein